MAMRNLWRNPRRTLLTGCAIGFASMLLVFMLSFQLGSYDTMINASVKIRTGHLQVQARSYNDNNDIRLTIPRPGRIARALRSRKGVEAVTMRARALCVLSSQNRSRGVLVSGIDPENEARVSTLKALVRKGEFLSPTDRNTALVGSILARHLKVNLQDELTLLGQARDGSIAATIIRVKGIYTSGMDEVDRGFIQIPLSSFQELFGMEDQVHTIVAVCESVAGVDTIQKEIVQSLPGPDLTVLSWKELMPGLVQGIKIDLASGIIFYLVLIVVVAASILNTFLMALFERTREFGILLAMGARPARLFKILFTESLFLTLLAAGTGLVAGSLLTLYFQRRGIDISGASEMLKQYGMTGRIYPRLSIVSALAGPLAVVATTLVSALYPALRVGRLSPMEAISRG
ncbi:MAG: ABC transporter permease [Desulfobacteraceae bacterium]|nr:ABC transporter permease [Desulfobacteraceae bacterium]